MDISAIWNSLTQSLRETIVGEIIATVVGGVILAALTFVVARILGKKELPPATPAAQQTQRVIVNVPPPQIVLREEPVQRGHAGQPHWLPLQPPIPHTPQYGFVARYDDQGNDLVIRVSQLLKQDRAVALLGSGGVGKTTLAAEIARKVQSDGTRVVWASADGRADFSFMTLLDEAATQLGFADSLPPELEQKSNVVRNLLTGSKSDPKDSALLVLDNFETIMVEQQKLITSFINTLSGPALITSRLAVEGADRVGVGAMSPREARDFLARLIANSPKRNALKQLKAEKEIARIAERNTMVMRWIVGQLELAQRISDVLNELLHGAGDAATRVFGRSFGLLNVDAQATLMSLALFVPSADRAALAFTAGFDDDIERLNAALKQLAALQLIESDEKNERLSVVGLTRRFTSARLEKDSIANDYRHRFVDYFIHYAATHLQTTPEDLDKLGTDRDNLLNAMDLAIEANNWESVMVIVDAMAAPGVRLGSELPLLARRETETRISTTVTHNVAELIRACLDGDESAWRELVERYSRLVYHIPLRYGLASDDADEVFMNVFTIVFRQLSSPRNPASLTAWLIYITLRESARFAQKQGADDASRQRYAGSLEIAKKLSDQ